MTRTGSSRIALAFLAGLAYLAPGSAATAASVDFASFFLANGTGNPLTFTNTVTGGTFSASTQVQFAFNPANINNPSGLPSGNVLANLTINAAANGPVTGTRNLDQAVGSSTSLSSITITEADNGKNLLTVRFAGDITGLAGGATGLLSADSLLSETVTYSSDFLSFAATTSRNFAINLTSLSPPLAVGPGGYLSSFTAGGSGTFSSDPGPTNGASVPEPASLVLLGLGLVGAPLVARRRLRKGATVA